MIKQLVVDAIDLMDSNILDLRDSCSPLMKGLGDAKKVVNLPLLFCGEFKLRIVMLTAVLIICLRESLSPLEHKEG
jgi:hypothetical protein